MQIKANPSLAIVIPVFNEAKVLPQALTSLAELSMDSSDSIIFVDGGSTDQSIQLIQQHGYQCLHCEAGRAKQMNYGTNNTKSDIILYLHVDTKVSSSEISNIKKSYTKGFLSGRFDIMFTNRALTYRIISFFINFRSRLSKISTGDQAIFIRRDIFEQIGGYPEIPLMEDVAISKALRRLGKIDCLYNKVTTSSRRWEKNGVVNTVMLMWKMRFLYWCGAEPEKLASMYRNAR